MLDLAHIPLRSADRKGLSPLVVAGGPCTCNPEPLADFVDLFFLGEGEEVDLEVIDLYRAYKTEGRPKEEFLRAAAQIEGVYVPSLYTVTYNEDHTIACLLYTSFLYDCEVIWRYWLRVYGRLCGDGSTESARLRRVLSRS